MNFIIPFTKDIKFKTNIGEITSISLEHEHSANEEEILGNFTISGDYKTHEVSVNKEPFEFVLPFSVELTERVDLDTVDLEILNFTYEIVESDTLRVNIEYSINALELKEDEKTIDEIIDEIKEPEELVFNEEELNRKIDDDTKTTVIDAISDKDDVFVTYQIHIMKETDTLDAICTKYNADKSILEEYNDLNNINVGDKVIIPKIDE